MLDLIFEGILSLSYFSMLALLIFIAGLIYYIPNIKPNMKLNQNPRKYRWD
jgi:hypothetical protein